MRRKEVPVCPPDKLLVSVLYSGISAGTELLLYRGEMPATMMADASISALDGTGYPRPYGYAAVGRVSRSRCGTGCEHSGKIGLFSPFSPINPTSLPHRSR
jgi:hypothetical protein